MGLDYQSLLDEICTIRKELESRIDGLLHPFDELASTAITTTPSPPTVQPAHVQEEQHADGKQDSGERKPAVFLDGGLTSTTATSFSASPTAAPLPLTEALHPPHTALAAHAEEQRHILKLHQVMARKLELDLWARDAEAKRARSFLSAELRVKRTLEAHRHLFGLNPPHFLTARHKLCVHDSRILWEHFTSGRIYARLDLADKKFGDLRTDPATFASSATYFITNLATFAHERLSASVCDHSAHGDPGPAYIVPFKIDPRVAVPERAYAIHAFESFHLGPVECALHATPLGGYDSSLDDDPESGFTHLDTPLDRVVGCIGHALAVSAALCADAVGAAGRGPLAWVVVAGSAQTTCSTVCPAGDRCFADVPVSVLWEEEMLRWDDNNHGLPPVSYMAELEVATTLVPPAVEFQDIPKNAKPKPVIIVTISSKPSSTLDGYSSVVR